MRILLVEDDDSIAKVLEQGFVEEHYAVDVARDGQLGWQLVNAFTYDLIVLDVVLPKLDGIQFCQRLRDCGHQMPVLMVTALDSSSRKIAGLDAGADDYITKPFELDELLARARVLLRRATAPMLSLLEWGDLQLNPNSQEVTYGDTTLNLTPKEYRLLELFLRKPSQVFSRSVIIDNLWNCGEAPGEDTVTAHIKGLRRKLTAAGAPSDLVKTVYGVGYRLKPFASSENGSPEMTASPGQPPQRPAKSSPPESARSPQAQRQQTQLALRSLWSRVKGHHEDRLATVKRALAALDNHGLPADLHQEAHRAAHSLKGALGVFGLTIGSDLAHRIEEHFSYALPLTPTSRLQLWNWVTALEQELAKGPAKTPLSSQPPTQSLLTIVDDNPGLTQALELAATETGWVVERISELADLQRFQQQVMGSHPTEQTQLQLGLFNCCLSQIPPATLAQISALIPPTLPGSVLVCSADGSLQNRIKAAQLGQITFLHNPDVGQILERGLLERSRPGPAKVLIVDDDPHVLAALRTLLEPWGAQLTTLNQSTHFWPTLQTTAPDLLILDIEMPDFNGITLCQVVRQTPHWHQLPIVFLTAHTDIACKHAAMLAGANDVIDKTLTESDLVQRLLHHLGRVYPVPPPVVRPKDHLSLAIG
ncbi:response regulator [Nodosilinea sp. P-1105]|uniref:response regulator n=1 Tax=Nodosilinea sp. P-1105 TaxID=2546229 RepID=UPI00146F7750|nr:response regulator [Nodosilinea sp. P-1105]NMF86522.1 response regulator [Nodosilinea sp. P-1105]